ncbi:Fic family protein [Chitinophaga pinensis]|uniref:Fic family protein n=1 Tax=Chitinophaga pinensis TaxID=79329 RepID=A0A5C6M1L3_9BACT|nr:Fic family protein [Chitinophaga pinensis]TWW01819.1 Fic family protein [Chitinophaga pinensis]
MSTKSKINEELEAIKKALSSFKDGASLEEIQKASTIKIGKRALQRRLEKLQQQGIVKTSGLTRYTKYYLDTPNKIITPGIPVPLSSSGMQIRYNVTQFVTDRQPVGYNFEFLTQYRPNIDSYLSEEEKIQLAELGKTTSLSQPAGTYAKEILQRLLIDLSWNSSRLEGNTYSLLDTQRLLSQGQSADNKTAAETQMILNHKDAIEFIVQSADEIGFNRYSLTNLHALLSNNLLADPTASGRLRTFGVGITSSVFTPLGIPQQIEEMFEIMLQKATDINDPFEQAFFIMVQLPYLQPFDDVNKRVARLAANIPLTRHNLAPLAFVDVPNDLYIQGMLGVYELNCVDLLKDVFMWAYERSALRYAALKQSLGEPDPFRLQYRDVIRPLIAQIITGAMSQKEATAVIDSKAATLPENDRSRFIETVETELLSLHEGNFARYWVRPSEFARWKEIWNAKNG